MAQGNQATPEKQLLNLIEKQTGQKSLHAAAVKYRGLSLFSLAALKGRFAFLSNRFKGLFKSGDLHELNIRAVNQVLQICVFILAVYFAVNLSTSIINLRKGIKLKTIEEAGQVQTSPAVSFLKKQAMYYLEKSRERDIFRMGVKKPDPVTGFSKGPSQRIIEATKDLKLVGISWSEDPIVMIEDTKTSRTFFLRKGQDIDNVIKLKAVFKDKVVLSFEQEELELR